LACWPLSASLEVLALALPHLVEKVAAVMEQTRRFSAMEVAVKTVQESMETAGSGKWGRLQNLAGVETAPIGKGQGTETVFAAVIGTAGVLASLSIFRTGIITANANG
jgi:1-deoxy-D-xylulose 5-phosphate reductoisomerase